MPARVRPKYNNRTYLKRTQALKNMVKSKGLHCWLCGEPFDLDLPYTHPMAFTADHVDPMANGGRLLGDLRPSHRSCNSRRGKRRTDEQIPRPKTTKAW